MSKISKKILYGTCLGIILSAASDGVNKLHNLEIRKKYTDDDFQKSESASLPQDYKLPEWFKFLDNQAYNLISDFPHLKPFGEQLRSFLAQFQRLSIKPAEQLEAFHHLLNLFVNVGLEQFSEPEISCVNITAEDSCVSIALIQEKLHLKKANSSLNCITV